MTISRTHTMATPTSTDSRFWWAAVAPATGALLSSLVLAVGWAFQLPSEVAMKWAEGTVVSVAPLAVAMASTLGPALAALVFLVVVQLGGKLNEWGRRSTVGALVALSLFLSGSLPALLVPSLAVADPWLAPDPGVPAIAALGVAAVLLGALAAVSASRYPRSDAQITGTTGTSGNRATTLWSETTTAWVFVALGVIGLILLALGIASLTPWPVALLGGVMVLLGFGLSRWAVTVDVDGLTCRPTRGPGSIRVTAEPGARASTGQASHALDALGLGIRGLGTRSPQLRFRLGKTLLIHRSTGETIVVTVEGAEAAAAAYNAAAERH
ncbi:hypothetical protein [uncultured Arthrobacter sp.]|uniref:hypothetical protein n=1 Tax=uncultured Arthrobacter sp. TaxID=114050 RepID=UPI0026227347|nr:hypothetical protein [uncultured Arthrobacter sp.]